MCCGSYFWMGANFIWAFKAALDLRLGSMLLYLLNIAVVIWLWPTQMIPKNYPALTDIEPETHIGTYYGLRAFDRLSFRRQIMLVSVFKTNHLYVPDWQEPVEVAIKGHNGYYLVNRLRDVYRSVGFQRWFCLTGIVEAKGTIVEHAFGARCETIRIVALATVFPNRRKLWAARYGVPVYATSIGLLRHYRRLKEGAG